MVSIRPAVESGEASVFDLVTSLMEVSLDRESFHEVFIQNLRDDTVLYYVAESDLAVVGFASLHILPQLHHTGLVGEILELIVRESLRGSGTGTQLVSKLEQEAQRFYEHMGFTRTHENFTKNLFI